MELQYQMRQLDFMPIRLMLFLPLIFKLLIHNNHIIQFGKCYFKDGELIEGVRLLRNLSLLENWLPAALVGLNSGDPMVYLAVDDVTVGRPFAPGQN